MITVSVITGVLSAAAAMAAEGAIQEAAKDAYVRVKALVMAKFREKGDAAGETALTQYESDPDTWVKPLEKSLTETGAGEDEGIVSAIQVLMKTLEESPGGENVLSKYNLTIKESKVGIIGDHTKVEGDLNF